MKLKSRTRENRRIGFWCFNPAVGFKKIHNLNPRWIILTSGTLSPLDEFSNELGTNFPLKLENPHVIDKNQVKFSVLKRGVKGKTFNFSYTNREWDVMINDLGLTIVEICKTTPGGVLAFFPSYSLMNRIIETWEKAKIDKDIERYKTLLVEPKESAHYPHVISSFYNDVYSKGSLLLGVCRGKIAEGLDFSDDAARAVVVIGVPYPLKTDPKTIMKQYYLDKIRSISNKGISSQAWFLMQATRATNQAIGRVIRHAEDYGNIILIDERFAEAKHKVSASAWLRDQLLEFDDFKEAKSEYEKFYFEMKSKKFIPKVDRLEKLYLEFHEQDNEYFKKIKDKIQADAALRSGLKDTKK